MRTINDNESGRIFIAITNIEDSSGLQIKFKESEGTKHLIDAILSSELLIVASSGQSCKALSVDKNVIKVDHPVTSAEKDYLVAGDIILIKQKNND